VSYQPIVSLGSGQITGFEALVRWLHPTRGLLPPKEFIPLAEDTGLIIAIDRWVLRQACIQMREWHKEYSHLKPLTVSVNLSGKQVTQPDLIEEIERVLHDTGMNPKQLKLEITENAIMDYNQYTAELFARLQAMGIQIQIDDFGVGYSSLSYISNFPINIENRPDLRQQNGQGQQPAQDRAGDHQPHTSPGSRGDRRGC
jgi:EAL domain-containing protein (putative c-di-GMP-specific phosphodiesterase class I)